MLARLPFADRAPDERTFWKKLARVAARIPFAEDLVAAWFCAVDPATPPRVRAILFGALAYFVLPTDVIPGLHGGPGLYRRWHRAGDGAQSPSAAISGRSIGSVPARGWSASPAEPVPRGLGAVDPFRPHVPTIEEGRTQRPEHRRNDGGIMNKALLGAALAVALATGAARAETWDMPMAYPETNFHTETGKAFAACVKEGTKGALDIVVHSNGSLFKGNEIKRAVQTGQAPIGERLLSAHENENSLFGFDSVPFLATSYEQSADALEGRAPRADEAPGQPEPRPRLLGPLAAAGHLLRRSRS